MENKENITKPEEEKEKKKKDRSKYKTFKEYYADPVFKARHDNYLKTKIKCTCGILIARYNKHCHLKTKKHERKLAIVEAERKAKEMAELKQYCKDTLKALNAKKKKNIEQ